MKRILVVDNYDSFTYNLVYIVRQLGYDPTIWRNDQFTLDAMEDFDKIILSPGPGIPSEAGLMPALIQRFAGSKSILGVCLGHQALGEAFGGNLINLKEVFHGVATRIKLDSDEPLFEGLPEEINVGRYHSWVVDENNFPADLKVTAVDTEGKVMALRHRKLDVAGVQFHPESVMTEHGVRMIRNWIDL
jgi:anthranilate synthase component 2